MARSGFAAGFAGFLIGVVTGLSIAAGAILVINKSPMPFMDKVERVTADVDPAAKLGGGVDPNARLNQTDEASSAAAGEAVATVTVDETGKSSTAPAAAPARPEAWWVQLGAFRSKSDAEQRAAELAMQGVAAEIQAGGKAGWRVRVGPFEDRKSAREVASSLADQGFSPSVASERK